MFQTLFKPVLFASIIASCILSGSSLPMAFPDSSVQTPYAVMARDSQMVSISHGANPSNELATTTLDEDKKWESFYREKVSGLNETTTSSADSYKVSHAHDLYGESALKPVSGMESVTIGF